MNIFKAAAKNKFAFSLIALGSFILIVSLLFDISGVGKAGVGPAQILIAVIGTVFALFGIGLILGRQEINHPVPQSSWLTGIPGLPNLFWVLLGLSVAYVLLLILPVFFSPAHSVVYFNRYLPEHNPIGWDFNVTIDSIRSWFAEGTAKVYYPPLVTILFAPLLLVGYPINYYIITILTVISFFILVFLIPFLIREKGERSIIPLVFGISIFSYGLQFELERGQFHTIALMLCILAIYLFHRHPEYRFFAYVLFCISVQFKIYPLLFIVMLVDDWRDWKMIVKRFVALGLVNFLLLFLLGTSYFSKFVAHMIASGSGTPEIWSGNHSINGFLNYLLTPRAQLLNNDALTWLGKNIHLLSSLFLAYFMICFLVVLANAYRRNVHDIDSLLMMACLLGGLLIPSINHDYTLPLLAAPFALVVSEQFTQNVPRRIIVILLLVVASFAYATTLVPFLRKPLYLQSNFPSLIILLTATTLFSFLRKEEPEISIQVE